MKYSVLNIVKGVNQVLFFVFIVFTSTSYYAQSNFDLKGTVKSSGHYIKGAKVEVYHYNDLIEVTATNDKGKYFVELEMNTLYTVKVYHEHMIPKCVQINTKASKNKVGDEVFFNMNLMENDFSQLNEEEYDLDFPFAILKYSQKSGNFEYDINHTKLMKQQERLAMQDMHEDLIIASAAEH